jgi:uncharacterized protein YjbI with pentapeptide repeats
MDANEVLREYEAGERSFLKRDLSGRSFAEADFSEVDLIGTQKS